MNGDTPIYGKSKAWSFLPPVPQNDEFLGCIFRDGQCLSLDDTGCLHQVDAICWIRWYGSPNWGVQKACCCEGGELCCSSVLICADIMQEMPMHGLGELGQTIYVDRKIRNDSSLDRIPYWNSWLLPLSVSLQWCWFASLISHFSTMT